MHFMPFTLYIFPCSAVVLEVLVLWRFSKHRLWPHYPYIAVFLAYDFLCNVALFPINHYKPEWFAGVYWRFAIISLFMRFLINWEFFRGVFGRSALQDVAWKLLLTVEVIVLPAILALGWKQASSVHYLYLHLSPVVAQYFSLVQATLLLSPAAVAWYYHAPLGRNRRGLCLGVGIDRLGCSAIFGGLQVFRGFAPYWRLLTPLTFIGMTAVWLWAFWEYAPTPDQASLNEDLYSQWKTGWQHLRTKTITLLRRGV